MCFPIWSCVVRDGWDDVFVTVVVLYGPKAAGKSQVAEALRSELGVAYVDADAIVLDLLARGAQPHPDHGWGRPVYEAVTTALLDNPVVSIEATGAWSSDWQLADDLEAAGQRVVRVWVFAPLEITLHRLGERTTRKVRVSEDEARWIWAAARDQAETRRFDLALDTSQLTERDLPGALIPLSRMLRPE